MPIGHVQDYYTFVGGLHTEGSFFLTPKNCWKEGDNVIPQTDGSLDRRNAINFEQAYVTRALTVNAVSSLDSYAYTTHIWKGVGGDGNFDVLIVQVGARLYFYNALGGTVSARPLTYTLNMASYQVPGNPDNIDTVPIQTAVVNGDLIITSKSTLAVVVAYENDTNTFIARGYEQKIRDFVGVYMDTDPTLEQTEAQWEAQGLRAAAIYNLFNQGWNQAQVNSYIAANSGKLPSNTKSWIFGKDNNDVFSPTTLNRQEFGSSLATKGRVIFNAFNQERAGLTTTSVTAPAPQWQDNRIFNNNAVGDAATTIYTNFIPFRPRAVGSFAGRAWYGGLSNGAQSGWVLFSQVVTDQTKLGNCYQTNDPTAEVLSDLLDDDGGLIVIPEVGEIVALRGSSNALIVFATNGIWSIVGGDNGFKASSYIVGKITNVGCLSPDCIVEIEDTWIYWSNKGIYALKLGQLGEGQVTNISDQNIKSYYNGIPITSRIRAVGTYDDITKKVEWVYGEDVTKPYYKTKSLLLDVQLNAWYTYTFDNTEGTPRIFSVFTPTQVSADEQDIDVFVDQDEVLVGADQVLVPINITEGVEGFNKYAILNFATPTTYDLTFADTNGAGFTDWGVAEKQAFFLIGHDMGNNGPARAKTGGYVSVFMKRTESEVDINFNPTTPSGCMLQWRWDFTDSANAGKWGQEYQVYRQLRPYLLNTGETIDDGYPLVITKNKLRGRGKAVQLKFSSETGKDMRMVGWSMTFMGNENV